MSFWLQLNLIIALSYLIFKGFRAFLSLENKFKFEQDFFKGAPFLLCLPLFHKLIPVTIPLPPVASKGIATAIEPTAKQISALQIHIPQIPVPEQYSFNSYYFVFLFLGLSFAIWLFFFCKDLLEIRKTLNQSILLKRLGQVEVYVSPGLKVPCSLWLPGRSVVLLTDDVLSKSSLLSHALSHELQHHRQGDTRFIYLLEVFKVLFYLNPFTHLWIKLFHEHRELKCDMEVLKRKDYGAYEYGNTLLDVVNLNSGKVLHRAWAMASLTKIQRRIKMITLKKSKTLTRSKRFLCFGLTLLFTWQAYAFSQNGLPVKKLSMTDAQDLVSRLESKIPLVVNEKVVKWLNYFMVDPKGKAYLIKSLERMHQYEHYVSGKLKQAGLPVELLAVPLMESGFNNSFVSNAKAAGIWQFIPATARRYGLMVNKKHDDRYHVGKLTQAAIDYYSDLMDINQFEGNWHLALLAYNAGESRVSREIQKQGTKNPWLLNGVGDKEYLAKVMAGIILLKDSPVSVFSHPLRQGRKTSGFGKRITKIKGKQFHRGLDLAARSGTPILSPLAGKVIEVSFDQNKGHALAIDHGNNIETRYYHLQNSTLKKGEIVKQDQQIAFVGNSGLSTGSHLHFELIIDGKNIDPEIYF